MVKEQIDAECSLVFQNDTVVHVLSEGATETTSTVSVLSKETGKCVMHGDMVYFKISALLFLSFRVYRG